MSQVDSRLVVVDPDVERSDVLRDGVRGGFAVLDLPTAGSGSVGGLGALAFALAGRSGVESLHILSHGSAGGMDLAAGRVDAAALAAQPALVSTIASALADDAEIVLYGCSVAAGSEGTAFVDLLSRLTGARVTASARPVGATDLGGDWSFAPESVQAFTASARRAFPGVLAVWSLTTVTTINTATTLTATDNGVTINAYASDGTDVSQTGTLAGLEALRPVGGMDVAADYIITFSSSVTITSFTFIEITNLSNGANYSISVNGGGTAVTVADNAGALADQLEAYSPSDWTNVTQITVSYAHGTGLWRPGIGNLTFAVTSSTPATLAPADLLAASDLGASSTDNITSATTQQLSGSATTGNVVAILVNGTTSNIVTAAGGSWSYTHTLSQGSYAITVQAATSAGGTYGGASSALNIVVDGTAPTTLTTPDLLAASDTGTSSTDNVTSSFVQQLSGSATTGDTVSIIVGSTTANTVTAAGGSWSYTHTLTAGSYAITVLATDTAGNAGAASTALGLVIDTTAPTTLATPDLLAASDTGVSSTDNVTSATTQQLSGSATTGDTVSIIVGGTTVNTVTAAGGSWSYTQTLTAGSYAITVLASDTAGNAGAASSALGLVVDTTAPTTLAPPDLLVASDLGASSTDNLTSSTTQQLSGSASTGDTVSIIVGSTTVNTVTAAGGSWSYTHTLTAGSYAITVLATDTAGNIGGVSSALGLVIDTTAPTTLAPPDLLAASDTGTSSTDNITNSTTQQLSGSATTGDTVSILVGGTTVNTVTAVGGSWSYTHTLTAGSYAITVLASDTAGNAGAASSALGLIIDTTSPTTLPTPDLLAASDSGGSSTDNITSSTTQQLSASTPANDLITILVSGTGTSAAVTAAVVTASFGSWSYTHTLTDGSYGISVFATDTAGNVGATSTALGLVVDTTAPTTLAAPDLLAASDLGTSSTDNLTSSTTQQLSGSASTGDTVSIIVGGTTANVVTAAGGSWSYTHTLTAGSYAITVLATDTAGNIGAASSALGIVIDTTAPGTVSPPDLAAASDTGTSSTDNVTADNTPTLFGATDAVNGLVHITQSGTTLATTTVGAAGTWVVTMGTLSDGTYALVAQAADAAGNTVASTSLSIVIDTTAPATLNTPDLLAASDTGSSSTDNITGSTSQQLSGSATTGDTVSILVGTTTANTVTAAGGSWSYTHTLTEGSYDITVLATDTAGNTSAASNALTMVVDTTPPTTLNAPDLLAASDLGVSSTDNITSSLTQQLSGSASVGDRVSILVGGTTVNRVTASGGSWSYTHTLTAGSYAITVQATDALGSAGPASASLGIIVDTTAPGTVGAPDLLTASDTGTSTTDNITSDSTPTLTGSGAVSNALVHVLVGGTTVGSVTASGAGAWTFTLTTTLAAGTHAITARGEDIAGNDGPASAAVNVVVDTTAPTTLGPPDLLAASDTGGSNTDNITSSTTQQLSGSATTGDTVSILVGGTTVNTVTAAGGSWSYTHTLTAGSYAITVSASDTAGNTGAASSALGLVVDTTAPTTLAPPDLLAASDLGVSTTDNITSSTTQQLSGSATTGDRVSVVVGGTTANVVTAAGGSWSYTHTLTAGSYAITVDVTDAAGNSGTASSALGIIIDTTAPGTVGPPDLLASSDLGTSSTDNLTSDRVPTFTGSSAVANALVHVLVGGTTVGSTTASGAGAWTFTLTTTLSAGTHAITARGEDIAGNDGAASVALNIVVDTTAPAAPGTLATPDLVAASDTGTSSTDNDTTDNTPTFSGTNASGSTVHALVANDVTVGTFTSEAGGTYSVTASSLAVGSYAVAIRELDAAGNASANSPALNIVISAPTNTNTGGGGGGGGGTTTTPTLTTTTTTTPTTTPVTGTSTTTQTQTIANTGSTSGSAAIVENTGNNANVVTATLPPSTSISSEGPSAAQSGDDAVTTLVNAVDARDNTSESTLISGAQTYLNTLAATTQLDVRTIIPTSTQASLSEPIVITGTSASEGSTQSEAFVIDLRTLTSTTSNVQIQLDNIEFASIMGASTITGGQGANYVTADDSNQFISLGEGADTLFGGDGNDTVGSGSGADSLGGEGGDDSVFGGTDNDTVIGGAGLDAVYGNQNDDVLYGNQSLDTLYGGQDNDIAFGGQDSDLIYGNLGADSLSGQLAADTLYGGQGDDVIFGGADNDVLFGNLGSDTLSGGSGDDTLSGNGGADVLSGGVGDDDLDGGDGADTLYGGASGTDRQFDVLGGGAGDDVIYGGEGVDWIYSGVGNDAIYIEALNGYDVLADFEAGADVIHIATNVNGTGIASFADVQAVATDNQDGNAELALGGGHIVRIVGVSSAQLTEDMFQFF